MAYSSSKSKSAAPEKKASISYWSKDKVTCPVCKKRKDTYFYQQGDYFACYKCVFGKKYKHSDN